MKSSEIIKLIDNKIDYIKKVAINSEHGLSILPAFVVLTQLREEIK